MFKEPLEGFGFGSGGSDPNNANFDCTLVCVNAQRCFQDALDRNVDNEPGGEGCKKLGGLIRSPVA